ncbi:acetyl-CoA carboxylase carboxyl transferase subunit beta [Lentzea tibetensis]|uniref:Multifunctional fusion protein n=1 Tax=Lentzea tibetensis TaxID=2591470 RepID=A0A563ESG5_9PSEU|nr:acetyl-CoA carboxylase carboxyltransferase subunit alpha/beta [Lentzea tibetensis]TWP50590.1 acetyl-CoA carboxylase carboxyl transferase subunit beta [Lentzea tibetensis]
MTIAREVSTQADWYVCSNCRTTIYAKRFARELRVCQDCGWHSRLSAAQRIAQLFDHGAEELGVPGTTVDPLSFVDVRAYAERHASARADTGMERGVVVVRGSIDGRPLVAAVMDFRFLGGSLGAAEGEAITVAAEAALAERLPLLVVTASGGARMQEGALSLMQMAKTSNAFAALDEAGLLTITLVTDPTYGGVAASFATLSDVVVAEPGARMGFAGPRVIEQTIRQRLPEGFQTAEYLLAKGLVDLVRPRSELRATLSRLLAVTDRAPARWCADLPDVRLGSADLAAASGWDTVKLARHIDRPTGLDHVAHLLDGFVELHGDRLGADCPALVGGFGVLDGLPVLALCHQKGHNTAELVARNFGMPSPAGYRKSARLLRLAAKLGTPVVALIDTPGAFPGIEAEENGQAVAIAENLRLMGGLGVPVVSVITGEGGSGGALALAVADTVLITQNGTYSVISPEGCASILWRDAAAAPLAAASLGIDPVSLLRAGVVDAVVPEPDGGSHLDPAAASELLRQAVARSLAELVGRESAELVAARRLRFRRLGLGGGEVA